MIDPAEIAAPDADETAASAPESGRSRRGCSSVRSRVRLRIASRRPTPASHPPRRPAPSPMTRPGDAHDLHPIHRWTGLGRPIDPEWRTNRAIVAIAVLTARVATAVEAFGGTPVVDATLAGARAGIVAFLGWAVLREILPDREGVAFGGAAIAAASHFLRGPQEIVPLVAMLVAARVVARTTGRALSLPDSAALVAGAILVPPPFRTVVALGIGTALILDGALAPPGGQPRRRSHLLLGAAVVLVGVVGPSGILGWVSHPPPTIAWPGGVVGVGLAALALAALIAVVLQSTVAAVGDVDGEPLMDLRARLGAGLGVGLPVLFTATGLPPVALGAAWGCIAVRVAAVPLERRRDG